MTKPEFIENWRRRFAEQEAESRALAAKARHALNEAVAILKKHGAKRIILFSSLHQGDRFHHGSDIDLAVEGIPSKKFVRASADLMMALVWPIDLKPLDEVDDFFRKMILQKGEVIYAE